MKRYTGRIKIFLLKVQQDIDGNKAIIEYTDEKPEQRNSNSTG